MALPPGFLDELRARITLSQVVGRRVAWDARKSNTAKGDHWAPCPFHTEKTASFHVDDRKGFYYCFGCHAKGDAVTFLRETENIGFMEAVERLAREAGMTMPARDPEAAARSEARNGLVDTMEAAVRFYRAQLTGARAAAARAYLDNRGTGSDSRERFELGYAPPDSAALFGHLTVKGVPPAQIAAAGLCVLPEDGGQPYDRFRDRIVFPIRDERGRAIAFGGRAMAANARAKYLNSPETALFDKGRSLYNIGPARGAAGRAGPLVVVEGYMDVIALVQAGIEAVVAPLGTAITADQLGLLWRVSDEPVIALDGDRAGIAAGQRLVDLALPLLRPGKGLRFALMPAGQDPDDVIRAGGRAAFEALLAASRPMIELIWERETEGASLDSPERRAGLEARLRGHLERIGDPAIRAHYQSDLRARAAALFRAGRPGRTDAPGRGRGAARFRPEPEAVRARTRASLLGRSGDATTGARVRESAILAGCLGHAQVAHAVEDRLERLAFLCPDLARIRDALLAALADEPRVALRTGVAARLGHDPLPDLLATGALVASPQLRPEAPEAEAGRLVEEVLARHAALTGHQSEVRDAERELAGAADEGVTWRLKAAAEESHRTATAPLREGATDSDDDSDLRRALQALIDEQVWNKGKKH
jgi:DNA primase